MTTEPYVPTEDEIRECATSFDFAWDEDGFDRFMAKIKADALREWSGHVQMELAASASHGIDLGEDFLHGAHSVLRQAGEFADRIEGEA